MRRTAALVALALALRLAAVWVSDRAVADVVRYQRLGAHLLDVSWNPYQAPRLYPYPPIWMWVEAGAEATARRLGRATSSPSPGPAASPEKREGRQADGRHARDAFPLLVKLPVVVADAALVGVLAATSPAAALAYALHPVAILVSAVHGQFDALALLPVVLACGALRAGHNDRAALLLALGIGVKSFPILLLPLFLLHLHRAEVESGGLLRSGGPIRFALLATAPVVAILLPFLLHDPRAVIRELAGYGGVADLGWIGVGRGLHWLTQGALARSEARFWPLAVPFAKATFLAAYLLLLALLARRRLRLELVTTVQVVLLGFVVLYGAISAQYLLWVLPLGLLCGPRNVAAAWSVSATMALVGIYLFLAPGVLIAAPLAGPALRVAGWTWLGGASLTLVTSAVWLAALLRRR